MYNVRDEGIIMLMDRLLSAVLVAVVICSVRGCQKPTAPQASPARAAPATQPRPRGSADGPVIGYLKTRDKVVTIRAGAEGPLYTITSKDGQVLAANSPASALAADFPDLNGIVNEGIADVDRH